MNWTSPFIVYHLTADNKLEEVFWAQNIKNAKYWLTYIAQPGDVLCRTPAHAQHSKKTMGAEYWSHKEASGTACSDELAWKKLLEKKQCQVIFPEEQISAPLDE